MLTPRNRLKDHGYWCGKGGCVFMCLFASLLAATILLFLTSTTVFQPMAAERVHINQAAYQRSRCEILKVDFAQRKTPSGCGEGDFNCVRVTVRLFDIRGTACNTTLFYNEDQENILGCSHTPCRHNWQSHQSALEHVFKDSLAGKKSFPCYYIDKEEKDHRDRLSCHIAYLHLPGYVHISETTLIASIAVPASLLVVIFALFLFNTFVCIFSDYHSIFHVCQKQCNKRSTNRHRRHRSNARRRGIGQQAANGTASHEMDHAHVVPRPPTYTEYDNQCLSNLPNENPDPPPPYEEVHPASD